MADRTIHARLDGTHIVRYDRAGKWYAEREDGTRSPLTLDDAVHLATRFGAYVYLGQPGGKAFDAKVKAKVAPASEREED